MGLQKEAPRVNSFKIDKLERPFKTGEYEDIVSVQLVKINMDEECKKDLDTGNGFFITNEVDFDEKTGARTMNGLYSPLYGADSFSDTIPDESYKCECGALIGGINEGEICSKCGTPVQFVDAKLSITGYINLGNFCIINPSCYTALAKFFGNKELTNIITYNNRFNINGKNISSRSKKSPYDGIGLIAFHDNFDEILEYYRKKNKKKSDSYDIIIKFKDCIFAHNIPVYSALLRPLVRSDSKISMVKDNKLYGIILSNANIIRDIDLTSIDKTIIVENSLLEIQNKLLEISDMIIKSTLSSKKGIFRGMICSARVDYSGRCIIVPAIGHDVNEVSMPYVMGCELMRPLLIKALSNEGYNIREANTMIDDAIRVFDKKIWILMNYLLKNSDDPPMLMVQRSPSLLQESMRLMNIKIIKADINDLTLDAPEGILDGMNADFDGDTFAVYMIYDNRLKKAWRPLHGPENHFISRHNGLYSNIQEFIKDSAVSLSEIWEIGKNATYYLEWASESERSEYLNRDELESKSIYDE